MKTVGVPVTLLIVAAALTAATCDLTGPDERSESSCRTWSPGTLAAMLATIESSSQPVFSVPWLSYKTEAKLYALFCLAAANIASCPRNESGPMKAHGFVSMRTFPFRTYFETSVGSAVVSKFWQIGHCRSMKMTICTGANGEPRESPFCG